MLQNRVKEHNSHVNSAIYKCIISISHPWANISYFKIIDQDIKQYARAAGETIHIRINSTALNCYTEKMYVPEVFNHLLEAGISSNESNQMIDSDLSQGHTNFTILNNKFSWAVCWQIKYP